MPRKAQGEDETAAAALGEMGELGNFGNTQQTGVEAACRIFAAGRHGKLNMVWRLDWHFTPPPDNPHMVTGARILQELPPAPRHVAVWPRTCCDGA